MYYQHVRNAVLDVCAKSVSVWGESEEMRGLLPGGYYGENNYLDMSFQDYQLKIHFNKPFFR